MRYISSGVFITLTLLFFSGSGFGQGGVTVVSTVEELETAVAMKAPIIELNAPEFILRDNLYLDFDCIFRPHSNQSIITIDCTYSYNLFIQNAKVTIGRDDPNCVFILTKGAWEGSGNIISTTKYVEALFYNCQFRNFGSYNGIKIRCGAYDLICSFNNCEASYNYFDGFNLHNTGPPPYGSAIITLNNCKAIGNDTLQVGGARGDGVTAHAANHEIHINGGEFSHNGKTGVAMIGGAKCYIDGKALFYNNGTVVNAGNIYCSDSGLIHIGDVVFGNFEAGNDSPHLNINASDIIITGNINRNGDLNGDNVVNLIDFSIFASSWLRDYRI